WIEGYGLAGREFRVRVGEGSPLAGRMAAELEAGELAGLHVLAMEQAGRFGRRSLASAIGARVDVGDVLLLDLFDPAVDAEGLFQALRLQALPLSSAWFSDYANDIGMAEMMVAVNSP